MDLVDRYKGLAPGLRVAVDDEPTCDDCEHVEMCDEVDACSKHVGMYHDWDMPESTNFAYTLRCDDFIPPNV